MLIEKVFFKFFLTIFFQRSKNNKQTEKQVLDDVKVLVIKQQHKTLVITEIKQVIKGRDERRETKWTGQLISKEMKRKNEKDHSGSGFVTPPKYLKEVLPWGDHNFGFETTMRRESFKAWMLPPSPSF